MSSDAFSDAFFEELFADPTEQEVVQQLLRSVSAMDIIREFLVPEGEDEHS